MRKHINRGSGARPGKGHGYGSTKYAPPPALGRRRFHHCSEFFNEMCRFGAAELREVAACIGEIASQEVIKLQELKQRASGNRDELFLSPGINVKQPLHVLMIMGTAALLKYVGSLGEIGTLGVGSSSSYSLKELNKEVTPEKMRGSKSTVVNFPQPGKRRKSSRMIVMDEDNYKEAIDASFKGFAPQVQICNRQLMIVVLKLIPVRQIFWNMVAAFKAVEFWVRHIEPSLDPFPWDKDGDSLPVNIKQAFLGEGIANGYSFRYPGSKPGSLFVLENGHLAFTWKESRAVLTLQRTWKSF
ncbi:hypothetical protein FNV43_RR25158 [Rhamnella rubrinervis]|uniref:Uncharacterized protein n=1 Tax=Rhamnella rubrinervis TaxID=2594499 RepID=A0A8K0DUJ3_9ROSA|nr:hypothetical protein FNV43_RR25158 [Rhamnella rubrinervis]